VAEDDKTVETRLALLEKEISQVSGLFDRLDTTIEKLSDVSSTIKQLLAVHETKINTHDDIHKDVYKEIDKTNDLINTKMATMETNVKKDIEDLTKEIKGLRAEHIDALEKLSKRTRTIENWRWTILGGVAIISWLLSVFVTPFVMMKH